MHDLQKKTDAELIKLSWQDDSYFAVLIQRYEAKLFRYMSRISSFRTETIEDLLQEVFVKVYQNLFDYDEQFAFSNWIYRIAHNVTISHVRKLKLAPPVVSIEDEDIKKNFIELLPSNEDIPREFDRRELGRVVAAELQKLPQKYRDVLVLYYLEDKSYKEISDILQRSVSSVSVLINRAKKKLKSSLAALRS